MYFIPIVAALVAIDRIVKIIITATMSPGDSFPLIKGIINITYVRNTGAAFGMFAGKQVLLLIITGLIMLGILIYLIAKRGKLSLAAVWSLSLILSGGIGNLIDRAAIGYVPDFLDLQFVRFAVFNVADIAITIGCILLFLEIIIFEPRREKDRTYHR